jgi:putative ATP-binding cassette transporter
LWPYASGSITYPDGKFLFLSQKPYIPLGTLRAAICYPQAPINDLKLLPVLNDVGLSHLAECLDIEENWSQILSVGEQQRVAFARALLLKPDVLFMDEASSALDENLENILYTRITRELKNSIIISVGHRSSIKSFHNLFLEWQEDLNWRLVPNEEYVEEGVYTENTGCDEEIHDDDLVKRFRNAYSCKNSPAGKPWYKRLFGRKNGED